MMWVAKVTVPEVAAVPPVLWKVTVTRSHHRLSASVRIGAERMSVAGVVGLGGGCGGAGGAVVPGGGAVAVRGGVVPGGAGIVPGREVPGTVPVPVSGPVPPADGAGVVPGGRGEGDEVLEVVPLADGLPSSGISVTDPDGRTASFGVEPAPTAA